MAQQAHSPLNELPEARRPALTLQERPHRGHLNLRGQPDDPAFMQAVQKVTGLDLPTEPNTVTGNESLSVLWLGPDEWLLVTEPGEQYAWENMLNEALADLFVSVTDVSSYYTTVEVAGHDAPDLLARGTTVDLHPRVFGPGCCAQTLLAKTTATIVHIDETSTFEVIVRRSFADYLWRWLADARAIMDG